MIGTVPEERAKRLTLVASILGSSIVFIDTTAVNVALPAIAEDLGAGLAGQQWVVEAYLLTLSSLLLVGGSLGDLLGRRRVFAAGVAAFGLTSLLCAAAPSTGVLIVARALQGAAGALLVPGTLAIIVSTFSEEERGGAIGSWTAWGGVSAVVGPFAGGLLVDVASWRWIFLLNLVPAALTLLLIARAVPRRLDEREPGRVDWLGAALCALGLAGVVFALIEQSREGWEDPRILGSLAAGVALLALFLVHERRTRDPMLPLALFRERNFAVGNAATLTIYAGLGAALFFLPLFLQQVGGYSAVEAGLALLPVTAIMFALSKRFGRLADRLGPRLFMGGGPLVAGAGLLLLVRIDGDAGYATAVLPAMSVFALGLAMTVAPLTAAVLAGVDGHHAGVASGVNNAVARVAGLLAIAGVGAVIAAQLPAGEAVTLSSAFEDASVRGFRVGMVLAGALVVAGGIVSLAGIRNPRRSVRAQECPGGAICGASEDVARLPARREPERVAA